MRWVSNLLDDESGRGSEVGNKSGVANESDVEEMLEHHHTHMDHRMNSRGE